MRMKGTLLTLTLCGLAMIAKSQIASVEQSTFGVQSGFLGVWAHSEIKLSNKVALRSELGFDSEIWGRSIDNNNTNFLLIPVITLEPRWYYNLNKRENKSRRIDGNSGNFISLKASYQPDWFVISNTDNVNIISEISFIPTWGIRRNIGKHFNYEVGIGIGYKHTFAKKAGFLENGSGADSNLHLRIGYIF